MENENYTQIVENEYTLNDALKHVARAAFINELLFKGGKTCIEKIMNNRAKLVLISKDCESRIVTIATHYAEKNKIPVITLEDKLELGKIVGLEKVNDEGKIKNNGCFIAVIERFNEKTKATEFVEKELVKA
jgi:small subunit ribosomal protein S12e